MPTPVTTSFDADAARRKPLIDGQYEVFAPLGDSLTGRTYLARQTGVDRMVVIKFMHEPTRSRSSRPLERFRREAKALGKLSHPHIARLFAYGTTADGRPYMVTEFVEGRTLEQVLTRLGWLSERRALRILDQIADALEEAHASGILHRNIKPQCIRLSDDRTGNDDVRLSNFGLVADCRGASSSELTGAQGMYGTPRYMSPEQATGGRADARSDIYSFGCVAYEMLVGRPPFEARTPMAYAVMHARHRAPLPSERTDAPPLHPLVERLLSRCLRKEPRQRYQNMSEVRRAIARALAEVEPAPEAPRRAPTRLASPRTIHPLSQLRWRDIAIIGATAFVSALVAVWIAG